MRLLGPGSWFRSGWRALAPTQRRLRPERGALSRERGAWSRGSPGCTVATTSERDSAPGAPKGVQLPPRGGRRAPLRPRPPRAPGLRARRGADPGPSPPSRLRSRGRGTPREWTSPSMTCWSPRQPGLQRGEDQVRRSAPCMPGMVGKGQGLGGQRAGKSRAGPTLPIGVCLGEVAPVHRPPGMSATQRGHSRACPQPRRAAMPRTRSHAEVLALPTWKGHGGR